MGTTIPEPVEEALASLGSEQDALGQLRAVKLIERWLREAEQGVIESAREQGHSWDAIAAAQRREPRADLGQPAGRSRAPCVPGLTNPDFNGVETSELRYWAEWWSSASRTPEGREEAGRDPRTELETVRAEIRAREAAGLGRDSSA